MVRELRVTPEDFGLARLEPNAIAGGDAEMNAGALIAILTGTLHPARDAVVLNAAATLSVATGDDFLSSARRAQRAINDGSARAKLESWRHAVARAQRA